MVRSIRSSISRQESVSNEVFHPLGMNFYSVGRIWVGNYVIVARETMRVLALGRKVCGLPGSGLEL